MWFSISSQYTRYANNVSLLLLVGLLSACTSFSTSPFFETFDWQAEGKLALRASSQDGGKNQSVSYRWRQRDSASLIEFFSPLGQRIFLVQKVDGIVTLVDHSGRQVHAETIAQMARQQMGMELPLDDLSDLMFESDSGEAMQQLDNAGWRIKRSTYNDEGRMKKLVLVNSSGSQLTFLVKNFE